MNATDQKEIIEGPICPYCDGMMVNGGCKNCGWRPEWEYALMEEE